MPRRLAQQRMTLSGTFIRIARYYYYYYLFITPDGSEYKHKNTEHKTSAVAELLVQKLHLHADTCTYMDAQDGKLDAASLAHTHFFATSCYLW